MARAKPYRHPLRALFGAAIFGEVDGMNSLQSLGLISDNCVEVEDVFSGDVFRVLEAAKVRFNPKWIEIVREAYERTLMELD